MRLCQMCWKNMKSEPANFIRNKINKNGYVICKECLKTETIQSLLDTEKWEVILETPTLYQELKGETK